LFLGEWLPKPNIMFGNKLATRLLSTQYFKKTEHLCSVFVVCVPSMFDSSKVKVLFTT
jgi:hypothetical protein